jgi:predicted dehydrogenase
VSENGPVRYGLIGAGLFGQFCVENYQQLDSIQTVAVADVNSEAAKKAAQQHGLEAVQSVEALLQRDDIDLVHIATPPTTHPELSEQAIEHGKHVLCEKPLAVKLDDAGSMIQRAKAKNRLLSVNLIMRYDPLCLAVKQIIDEQLLGQPLHGFFENYAKDEPLGPSHWFWEVDKSGGIFIEHGVHFFDLFAWWLGRGRVLAAQHIRRPGNDSIVEQVHCTCDYLNDDVADNHVLVNFYHGFTQAARMDRQEMRILCERGTIRLFEWVPTAIAIDTLADQKTTDGIAELLPRASVTRTESYDGEHRRVSSRHKQYEVDGRYTLTSDTGMDKPALYGHVLRHLLDDQVKAIRDPNHARRVTEDNGFTSLRMATEAFEIAEGRR